MTWSLRRYLREQPPPFENEDQALGYRMAIARVVEWGATEDEQCYQDHLAEARDKEQFYQEHLGETI